MQYNSLFDLVSFASRKSVAKNAVFVSYLIYQQRKRKTKFSNVFNDEVLPNEIGSNSKLLEMQIILTRAPGQHARDDRIS